LPPILPIFSLRCPNCHPHRLSGRFCWRIFLPLHSSRYRPPSPNWIWEREVRMSFPQSLSQPRPSFPHQPCYSSPTSLNRVSDYSEIPADRIPVAFPACSRQLVFPFLHHTSFPHLAALRATEPFLLIQCPPPTEVINFFPSRLFFSGSSPPSRTIASPNSFRPRSHPVFFPLSP